jgi:hypothetical protein
MGSRRLDDAGSDDDHDHDDRRPTSCAALCTRLTERMVRVALGSGAHTHTSTFCRAVDDVIEEWKETVD